MQAALFRNGILWRLPLSRLDAWRESPSSVSPSDHDYHRLAHLRDPETAAIAVLAAHHIPIDLMSTTRLTGATVTGPDIEPTPIPEAALPPLLIAAELNNGALVNRSPRKISVTIKYLTQQFGFPLPTPRSPTQTTPLMMRADDVQLVPYRKEHE